MSEKCQWSYVPFTPTSYIVGAEERVHPGFNDQWRTTCMQPAQTLRVEPRHDWSTCSFCGKDIEFLDDPEQANLPKTVQRLV